MSVKEKVALTDGFSYCEVKRIFSQANDGSAMVSRNGTPMINIQWMVVDIDGNVGTVSDYITSTTTWKISNLENCLGIKDFYDYEKERFNIELLGNKACGAVIRRDQNPLYGSKIYSYVPLSFYNVVGKKINEKKRVDASDKSKLSKEEINNDLLQESTSFNAVRDSASVSQKTFDDDEIPF